jgi:6-pyruvoyl-tetrahydropterin synthase
VETYVSSVTLFYKHLTALDFAYWDQSNGPMGESYWVNVELSGQTDHEGVIFDFSLAKKAIKDIVDRFVDHCLVVPSHLVEKLGSRYLLKQQNFFYEAPSEAFALIEENTYSPEALEAHIAHLILTHMPKNIVGVKVILEREYLPSESLSFQYTHGLKMHYGNCQRLLHGHRNTLEIWVNEVKRPDIEKTLISNHWNESVHFVLDKNIVNNTGSEIEVAYTSSQGLFTATIPSSQAFILPHETTIELLSDYFASMVVDLFCKPNDVVKVIAYEGMAKGAISQKRA